MSYPHPESKQLIVNREYEVKVNIYNKENQLIHPSENILTKTTFGKQFDILEVKLLFSLTKPDPSKTGLGGICQDVLANLVPNSMLLPHSLSPSSRGMH